MPQTFPFTRANPSDWSPGQRLTSAQANTLDKNAAQAADGLLWSEIAILKSFRKSTITNGGPAIFWDPPSGRWINGGANAGAPTASYSFDGADDWTALTVPAGTNWGSTTCGASNGSGTVILCGGGGSATTSKIRQSSDSGNTWSTRNVNAGGSEFISCIVWHPAAALFIIGLSNAASTNIEISGDGITWTQRTGLPNSLARGSANGVGSSSGAASNGSVVVMLAASSSNKCLRSTDGATWTESTLPSTSSWTAVAWNATSGKFMAIASNAIATSADGITWSSSGLNAPFNTSATSLTSYGRAWLASGANTGQFGLAISKDDGVSWRNVKICSAALYATAIGDNQACAVTSGGVVYASIRGGL